jgi:hypothetical protein
MKFKRRRLKAEVNSTGTDYREEDLYDYLRNKEPAVEEFQEIIKSQTNQALVVVYFISKFHI